MTYPETLWSWAIYLGILAGGGVIYFLATMIFQPHTRAGERLIVFIFGIAIFAIAAALVAVGLHTEASAIGKRVAFGVSGVGAGLCGFYFAGVSFFGSPGTVDKLFRSLLRGL